MPTPPAPDVSVCVPVYRVHGAPHVATLAADLPAALDGLTGELVVVRASPAAYEEIGRQQFLGPTRQAPSLSNGLIYLRDEKEIVCLDVRQ